MGTRRKSIIILCLCSGLIPGLSDIGWVEELEEKLKVVGNIMMHVIYIGP